MNDRSTLEGIFRNLDRYVDNLRRLAKIRREDFLADLTKTGSARYYLQVAIGGCPDAASHIIADRSLRSPESYADVFAVLGEAGIVPTEFVPTLHQMARLRNRLVHLYWEIDDEVLYQILTTELDDFDHFKACVFDQMDDLQDDH